MKIKNTILLSSLLIAFGCQQKNLQQDIPTIQINENYPEKTIKLQDFANTEYVALETTDSFITQGYIQSIGKEYIIAKNYVQDGNIFVFDRLTGKGLNVINHLGQGDKEYTNLTNVVLSESSDELFVSDYPARKILVYNLNGDFKRSFSFADKSYYIDIANYDHKNLIAFKGYIPNMENEKSCHILISKENGKVVKEFKVPINKYETIVWSKEEAIVTPSYITTTASNKNWTFNRMSSDTIYQYVDGIIKPVLARTPSIHSMDIQKFLYLIAETDRYYFMQILEKKFNLEKMRGFNVDNRIYDKQAKEFFTPVILNDDFSHGEVSIDMHEAQEDRNVISFQTIEASKLVEANEAGKLKGKLKSIASKLNEGSNPVILILKNK